MPKFIDRTGQIFGKLKVLERAENYTGSARPLTRWLCKCECGNTTTVISGSLTSGNTRSCGCGMDQPEDQIMHGMTGTPEYRTWSGMKQRCYNRNHKQWQDYGGRGIKVCDRWLAMFEHFYEDMGPRPSRSHSVDRINTNGNYEKANCRWATRTQQQRNMRAARVVTYEGRRVHLLDLAKELGVHHNTLEHRIKKGWRDIDLTRPPRFVPPYIKMYK